MNPVARMSPYSEQAPQAPLPRPASGTAGGMVRFAGVCALAALAYEPWAALVHAQWPLTIGGYSAFITVLPTCWLLGLFVMVALAEDPSLLRAPVLLGVLGAFVAAMRSIAGIAPNTTMFGRMNNIRWVVLMPAFLLLWRVLLRDRWISRVAANVVVLTGIGYSITGILYALHIANITGVATDLDQSRLREAGTRYYSFSQPNEYGAILLSALALLCLSRGLERSWFRMLCIPILFLGIMTSISRWPVICGGLLMTATSIAEALLLGPTPSPPGFRRRNRDIRSAAPGHACDELFSA